MKHKLELIVALACACACAMIAYAAQDTAIERVEVRDPVRLEAYLEANATDAETRIAALEGGIGTNTAAAVTVGSLTTTGAVVAASYAVGASAGLSCVITNISTLSTNILTYTKGILTAKTVNP
jgi:hypothetical protein